jgi:hypothetical protein
MQAGPSCPAIRLGRVCVGIDGGNRLSRSAGVDSRRRRSFGQKRRAVRRPRAAAPVDLRRAAGESCKPAAFRGGGYGARERRAASSA